MRIAFLHPDLGIGGAERFIVDAALAMKNSGNQVHIFTSHYDPKHAFGETTDGSLSIKCFGDQLPTQLCSQIPMKIFWAILRSQQLAFRLILLVWFSNNDVYRKIDLIFVDQISASIPFLKQFIRVPIVFYCHYPDKLLTQRKSLLKYFYRIPFDQLERQTTGLADKVLVNSFYTQSVFQKTFNYGTTSLFAPDVLYPSINFDNYPSFNDILHQKSNVDLEVDKDEIDYLKKLQSKLKPFKKFSFLLSINRFERKKNIELAVHSFIMARKEYEFIKLIICGGYDPNNNENKEYFQELQKICIDNDLKIGEFPTFSCDVIFLRSFSELQRSFLFDMCCAVLYTPSNEHFGIVPIEAMYSQRPVIAVNSGGPIETIVDCKTGYLCEPDSSCFCKRILDLVGDDLASQRRRLEMGSSGHDLVLNRFSFQKFSSSLNKYLSSVLDNKIIENKKHD